MNRFWILGIGISVGMIVGAYFPALGAWVFPWRDRRKLVLDLRERILGERRRSG